MIILGSSYANMGMRREIRDVTEDEEGIGNMKNLGENMV
jgi:hypothetical protein